MDLKHEDGSEMEIKYLQIFSIQVFEARGDGEMIRSRYIE